MNANFRKLLIVLVILFAVAGACLFQLFYKEAENLAIAKLNEQQRIHASQASGGIEEFFTTWTRNLGAFAKMDGIAANNAVGQADLRILYEANQEFVTAITRLDEKGVITYNFPTDSSVGLDISGQKHIRELLRDHKPVISDVFKSVEGYDAVAMHVPVFDGAEFRGSVGILINFENLAHRYLEVIRIGETGYAWVLSRDGTILYTPVPGYTGKSVFETTRNSPQIKDLVDAMLAGQEGVATYPFDKIGVQNVAPTRKFAVYLPVRVGNTFWSIAVASAEEDVLSGLTSFRKKLTLVIAAMFVGGMVFSVLGAKAWLIVSEEEKRREIEAQLRKSEAEIVRQRDEVAHLARVTTLGEISGSLAHELGQPLGAILANTDSIEMLLQSPTPDLAEVRVILADIRRDDLRASEIIHGMRAFLRRQELNLQPLEVRCLAEETVKLVSSDAAARKTTVGLEIPPDLPLVRGDRIHLQQVLLNLLVNGMDALSTSPVADRRMTNRAARIAPHTVEFAVSDAGVGIPPADLDQIFTPFHTTKQGGLGLGLPICRSIIEAHGGSISLQNNPDRGTTARFTLPACQEGHP